MPTLRWWSRDAEIELVLCRALARSKDFGYELSHAIRLNLMVVGACANFARNSSAKITAGTPYVAEQKIPSPSETSSLLDRRNEDPELDGVLREKSILFDSLLLRLHRKM